MLVAGTPLITASGMWKRFIFVHIRTNKMHAHTTATHLYMPLHPLCLPSPRCKIKDMPLAQLEMRSRRLTSTYEKRPLAGSTMQPPWGGLDLQTPPNDPSPHSALEFENKNGVNSRKNGGSLVHEVLFYASGTKLAFSEELAGI